MAKNGNITNRDLYDAIEKLETKVMHRVEKLEEQVDENTNWRNKIVGQFTVVMIFIGTGINLLWDKFINKN